MDKTRKLEGWVAMEQAWIFPKNGALGRDEGKIGTNGGERSRQVPV